MSESLITAKHNSLLSIVIISRNEATHIASAVESALREAEHYPGTEILVVDSASTDATIEIASCYPIGVVRIPATRFLSAAAGRYIGYLNTCGQFLLHLDGDMTLCPGWLAQALPYMLEHPPVAGCSGYWENIHTRAGVVLHREMIGFDPAKKINAVEEFGGAALYRRSALKQVGGFNPYIYSYEEPELCARLRHAGFDLAILPEQISEHYGLPEHSLASYWRRWNSQLWIGCGQMLRYHFGKDTFAAVARLQGGRYLLLNFAAALGVLFFLLLGVTLQNPWLVLPGFAGMVIFLAMLLYRKQSIPRALLSLLLRVLILLSGIKGFLMSPVNPATYPTEIETIKATPHTGAVQGETRD